MAPRDDAGERVCLCNGPWQILTLCASLQTHHASVPRSERVRTTLALTGERLSGEMRRTMDELSRRFELFDRVCWIDDVTAPTHGVSDAAFEERLANLKSRLDVRELDEIWTANPGVYHDRVLYECYPDARIILFEDGLYTYTAAWSDSASILWRVAATGRAYADRLLAHPAARAEAFRRGIRLLGQSRRKPERAYLILAGTLEIPAPYRKVAQRVSAATLRDVVERVDVQGSPNGPQSDRRRALVLSNSYSFWSAMTWTEEAGVYERVIARLDAAGYEVWWKEHPRVIEPFLPELRRRLPEVALQPYGADHTLPLEVSLRQDPVDLIVAGTSTALLYAPLIFGDGVRVASFADTVRPFVRGLRLRTVRLVQSAVPRLEDVLAQEPPVEVGEARVRASARASAQTRPEDR